MSVAVVIPAAGSGRRFGGNLPKQFVPLVGIPILARTMLAFQQAYVVESIVVAVNPEYASQVQAMADTYGISKLRACVPGGEERQHSIVNALAVDAVRLCEIVLVHDAVRPFIDEPFITSIAEAARQYGAAVPGLVPKETIKQVDEENRVVQTPNRVLLRAVQTPQGFRREVIDSAYKRAEETGFVGTDDASVVEHAGYPVHIADGREENIKITTPLDMSLARLMVDSGQL